ncbi:YfhE family protein [Virgibacillus dakarensis]|nr:YfhE family protein [Virgibacillus dakarensis]
MSVKKNPKNHQQDECFLNKTQQVHYQREFKSADRVYNQFSQKGNRG